MSEKRRGLGRGLGALIPPAPAPAQPDADRPVDVFFPDRKDGAEDDGQPQAKSDGGGAKARGGRPARTGVPPIGPLGGGSSAVPAAVPSAPVIPDEPAVTPAA